MNPSDKERAARAAVQGLMKVDRAKALAVAVMLAGSSVAGCVTPARNKPCPGQPGEPPCVQPSGSESGWLEPPRWPAVESAPSGSQGVHLAAREQFLANPQYTQLRAGSPPSGGPSYYGGGYYYRIVPSIGEDDHAGSSGGSRGGFHGFGSSSS